MALARWLWSWKFDFHYRLKWEFGLWYLGTIVIPIFVVRMETVRPLRMIQHWPHW